MASILLWSSCTPYNTKSNTYNVFSSRYKNIRYNLRPYTTYTVTAKDVANLPGISFNVYGTTDLWHIILAFNGLSDPLNDLYPGLVLNIPNKSDVLSLLSQAQSTNTIVRSTI